MELERFVPDTDEYIMVPLKVCFTLYPAEPDVGLSLPYIDGLRVLYRDTGDVVNDLTKAEDEYIVEKCYEEAAAGD